MWTKGRKEALVDSIIELAERKNIDIAGNELLLNGFKKLNEKELLELEDFISDLVK